ncbi:MAG: hypothetical protein LBP92_07320 [Deltaproteobacteria bacterium]|jgi:hypothetical protein|nr:hypothetical protein [Deltaproteobacteria bacterium]
MKTTSLLVLTLALLILLAQTRPAPAEMDGLYGLTPTIGPELPNLGFVTLRGTFPDPQCPALSNSVGLAYPIGIGARELERALGAEARASFSELAGNENGFCPEPGEEFPSSRTSETRVSFTARAPGRNHLSILTTTYAFGIGAAHGGSFSEAVTYDLRTGERLELWDLFADPAEAVPRLWDYVAKGWCVVSPQGTLPSFYELPDSKCFSGNHPLPKALGAARAPFSALGKVILTPEGMTVSLDPYEGWSFADGPSSLDIPRNVLLRLGADRELWD